MAQNNESVIRGMYEAFNKKDFEALKGLGLPQSNLLQVAFQQSETGPLAVYNTWTGWAEAFPDGTVEVRNILTVGDYVVAECIGRGTHEGVFKSPLGNIPATGLKAELPFCDVIRIQEGKILSSQSYFDVFTLLRQLGLESKTKAA